MGNHSYMQGIAQGGSMTIPPCFLYKNNSNLFVLPKTFPNTLPKPVPSQVWQGSYPNSQAGLLLLVAYHRSSMLLSSNIDYLCIKWQVLCIINAELRCKLATQAYLMMHGEHKYYIPTPVLCVQHQYFTIKKNPCKIGHKVRSTDAFKKVMSACSQTAALVVHSEHMSNTSLNVLYYRFSFLEPKTVRKRGHTSITQRHIK